jgi:hypothetical protein
VASGGLDHAVEVVVPVGHPLVTDRTANGVAEQEDADLRAITPRQGARQAKGVLSTLGAIRRVVADHERVHRSISTRRNPEGKGPSALQTSPG